jgi:hypothetical protein
MDNKALGIKILKSTALFTGKAAWFLLCKACLGILFIIGFIVERMSSSADESEHQDELGTNPFSNIETGDPRSPHYLLEKPRF